jgi:hypothetical protein
MADIPTPTGPIRPEDVYRASFDEAGDKVERDTLTIEWKDRKKVDTVYTDADARKIAKALEQVASGFGVFRNRKK